MKKTLIALAVAGVVAAPAAMADVTVYGQAHVSIGQENNGKDGYLAVNSNSSRFGIKAAESLDGGLTAVAQMEFGVAMDSNGTTQAVDAAGDKIDGYVPGQNVTARNQFVGLAGGFGTILAGRHDAPLKMSTGGLDVFADTVGDYNAVIGQINVAAAGVAVNTDVRADNAIAYVAPAIAGATIVLAYVPDEVAKDAAGKNVNNDVTSAAVMWGQGPLTVDVGYLAGLKDKYELTALRLGVGYAISDALKVAAIYETDTVKATTPDVKATSFVVNAAFNMGGGNTIKAEFGTVKDDTSGISKESANLMAIGLDHAFSKNTSAYVVYASMANDKNAKYALGGAGYGSPIAVAAAGKDPNALEVGMVVKF